MKDLKYICFIPARFESSRFPGKPLAMIGDKMMIQRVWERVSKVLPNTYVATDDERISSVVESFGGKVVLTSRNHKSGTDRCREALDKVGGDVDVVINVQGDEPFIMEGQIHAIMNCFDDDNTQIATLARPFDSSRPMSELIDPSTPKLVVDNDNFALYFSRSIIPYLRGQNENEWAKKHDFFTHVGMYAYRSSVLREISNLPQSSLELAESLEQLRWLQNGYKIKVGFTNCPTIGIDTPQDLQSAIKMLDKLEKLS